MTRSAAKHLSLAIAAAISLSGCAHKFELGGDPQLRVLDTNELPTPGRNNYSEATRPYFVGPYDRLTIDVFGIEELSKREVQVDGAGRISFPLIGVVDVNGKTPGEIENEIAAKLAGAYVRNPQVSVNVKDMVSRVVTVGGEVRMPGQYPVIGRMTLMTSIARAQGTTEFSNFKEVVVFRTVDGQRYAALYNLDAIRAGQYADPEIYANDVIMVGNSSSRRLFKDVMTAIPAFLTPLVIAVDRLSN